MRAYRSIDPDEHADALADAIVDMIVQSGRTYKQATDALYLAYNRLEDRTTPVFNQTLAEPKEK